MPKHNTTPIQLPAEQPDCCALCPLVGIIPKANRPKGTKETHCCLGTMEALSGRGINLGYKCNGGKGFACDRFSWWNQEQRVGMTHYEYMLNN